MQQRLLAHVVDDDARGVVSAAGVPDVFGQEVLENLTEHFGVNGNFLFQRLGLVDGEVVAVENVEDAGAGLIFFTRRFVIGKKRVGQKDIGFDPLVAVERLKESAV